MKLEMSSEDVLKQIRLIFEKGGSLSKKKVKQANPVLMKNALSITQAGNMHFKQRESLQNKLSKGLGFRVSF